MRHLKHIRIEIKVLEWLFIFLYFVVAQLQLSLLHSFPRNPSSMKAEGACPRLLRLEQSGLASSWGFSLDGE